MIKIFSGYQQLLSASRLIMISLGFCASTSVFAHKIQEAESIVELDDMEVIDRSTNLLGISDSASVGFVGQEDFEFRPLLRSGELVEVVPGMMATQHSGSGKANQYFLRGFNLDHGTDFSAKVDGVPMNMPTHGHGQGYLDLNSIIPELVDFIEFGKGPYHSEVGDFSSAGYTVFHTKHKLDKGLLKFGIGVDDYYRGVVANSNPLGEGHLLYGAEVNFYNGPWTNSEELQKYNGLLRYTVDRADSGYSLVGTAYYSQWSSTDQIPQRAVERGLISDLDTIDDTDGGNTQRYSFAANWWKESELGKTDLSFYSVYYDFNLYSNFSFFLEDPVRGDQIYQKDRRVVIGGEGKHSWDDQWFGFFVNNQVGVQVRHDYIPEVALHKSHARQILSTVSEHEVNQTNFSVFLENTIEWHEKVKTTVGVRSDAYFFDVDSISTPVNSGKESDVLFSPKFSLVLGPWFDTEYYLNLGHGFHSNDARGTSIRVDPNDGSQASPVDPLVRTRGAELGLRTQAVQGVVSTLAVWWLESDSELVFVGDGGSTEASGASQRYGVEWTNIYKPLDWLTLDLDMSFSKAEFTGVPGNEKYVPNSVGRTISAGATVDLPNGLFGSIRARHFGDIPLTEDGQIKAGSTTLVNLGVGYRYLDYRIELNVLNLLDSNDRDVTYYYPSRLRGEPAGGVEDIHYHPVEPRTFRIQMSMNF